MVGEHRLVITESQVESNMRVIYDPLNVVYIKVSIFDWLENSALSGSMISGYLHLERLCDSCHLFVCLSFSKKTQKL